MNNIEKVFSHGKAFIPFITCGDPSLEITEQLVLAMERAGADLVELGIPFSDPTAEGPVIQAANLRALSGGVTTDKIFQMVRRIRTQSQIPLVFMTYLNPVFHYGYESPLRKRRSLMRCAKNMAWRLFRSLRRPLMNGLHVLPGRRMDLFTVFPHWA